MFGYIGVEPIKMERSRAFDSSLKEYPNMWRKIDQLLNLVAFPQENSFHAENTAGFHAV